MAFLPLYVVIQRLVQRLKRNKKQSLIYCKFHHIFALMSKIWIKKAMTKHVCKGVGVQSFIMAHKVGCKHLQIVLISFKDVGWWLITPLDDGLATNFDAH